jgi:AraC-like DNA-binding protein/TM2 domain-containing membrane protein YozV
MKTLSGASFLLSFLLFFHPFQQNVTANRWLSLFVFVIGNAFIGSYLLVSDAAANNILLFKFVNSVQFLLAPSFYLSVLYFTSPSNKIIKSSWIHFVPFIIYAFAEHIWKYNEVSISTHSVFTFGNSTSFLVRSFLPVMMLPYFVFIFVLLKKHQANVKRIASNVNQINLNWLIQFLYILAITLFIWLNDELFGFPYILEATNIIYSICILFLAYFSIQQKTIFAFKEKDLKEISEVLEYEDLKIVTKANDNFNKDSFEKDIPIEVEKEKPKRLNTEQITSLSAQLSSLMEKEKLFLDNDLNLPAVAEKLGISIHEASFLINETTKDNFYNFINKYRVEEAKKLLASSKMQQLNILGIAYESGFNSKTTFNTTFKRIVGISPSQYSNEHKKIA